MYERPGADNHRVAVNTSPQRVEEVNQVMSENYAIDHIGVVAWLLYCGYEPVDVQTDPQTHRVMFVFAEDARAVAVRYFGTTQVDARTYQDAIKRVLDMLKFQREVRRG